jgi:hypothetical protein
VTATTDNGCERAYAAATTRRSALIFVGSAAALVGSAVALAHNTPHSWTVAKARVMLQEGTNIALPEAQRQELNVELEAQLAKFRLLLLQAQERPEDWLYAQTYDNYIRKRFLPAQQKVLNGLSIDSVKCVGQGKASSGKRYRHFRCPATSYVLEIPTVELKYPAEGELPEVIEGPVRRIGPIAATFTVHVMGKSRMLSQRAS